MTPDSAISTGSALHSALLMNADAAEHGQPVRLAVLAMVGTTVYDGGLMDRALSRSLVEQGVPAGSVRFEGMLRYARERSGMSRMTVFTELFDDPLAAASANKRFELNCDELIADGGVRAVPGAEETIGWLRDAGVKVCLATGFGRHTQNMVLESLGWMGLADLSLCPADAGRGRPFPDMVLTAVLALDIDDVRKGRRRGRFHGGYPFRPPRRGVGGCRCTHRIAFRGCASRRRRHRRSALHQGLPGPPGAAGVPALRPARISRRCCPPAPCHPRGTCPRRRGCSCWTVRRRCGPHP